MPLSIVTMRSSRSADQKDRLSRAIHAASIVAGYPEDDLFQRFLSLEPSDPGAQRVGALFEVALVIHAGPRLVGVTQSAGGRWLPDPGRVW